MRKPRTNARKTKPKLTPPDKVRRSTRAVAIDDEGMPEFLSGLTEEQRQAVVAEEIAVSEADLPSDPAEAALVARSLARLHEDRARRRGRPRIGLGAAKFNVTMERTLLAKVDAYAKRNHMTRAAVLARGVEQLIGADA